MSRRDLIDVAMGKAPADQIIDGGVLVNVLTAELYPAGIAIKGNRIAAVGDVSYTRGPQTKVTQADGRYLVPGLVDGHLHSYHSYLGVNEFVQGLLTHGVTATADGFYGQGIVGGIDAVRFVKEAFERMPIRLIFLVPTLAYLQNRELGLTPVKGISVEDMFEMLDWPGCYGLEEPPSLPIIEKDEAFLRLFEETLARRKVVTGHASGLNERQVQAYVAMGAYTEHESFEHHDALMKARAGLKILARLGSGCVDLPELMRAHTELRADPRAFAFCVDVASPEKLIGQGALDENVRAAIANGVNPVTAIQMASINVAEIFYAQQDVGTIAPGRFADILLVDDLARFSIDRVLVGGQVVVKEGRFVAQLPATTYPTDFYQTVVLASPVTADDLTLKVDTADGEADVRVIGVTEGNLLTTERRARVKIDQGRIVPNVEGDVLPIAMVDRFGKGTGIGLGLVQGFGLHRGAMATSVNAVCENLVVVGTNAHDMAVAVNHLAKIGGGKVIVEDGRILALIELPLLGLLSEDPMNVVSEKFDRAFRVLADLGCQLKSPFSQLEFCCACGEMGAIKISDEGLLLTDPPRKVGVLV